MLKLLTDFFRDAYTGRVDTLTGFALVATSLTCFVWQHSQVSTELVTEVAYSFYHSMFNRL